MAEECIFCQIASGAAQAEVVFDGEETLFFQDISPKATVHIIGIPKRHISSVDGIKETDRELMGQLLLEVGAVAREAGLVEGGYRVISNVGQNSGQVVPHLHWHILGGEALGPLRC